MAARNEKKQSNSVAAVPGKADKNKRRKFQLGIFVLLTVLLFLSGIILLAGYSYCKISRENPRFTLRQVQIDSSGFWGKDQATRDALATQLNLRCGQDNIFALSSASLRKILLEKFPNIAEAEVRMLLPDTIQIKLDERIPRAFVGRPNSIIVLDANGMVMRSDQCFGVTPQLPSIVGYRNRISIGKVAEDLRGALDIVMNVQRSFPEFRIIFLSVRDPERFVMTVKYRNQETYQVTVQQPGDNRLMLDVLRATIENARRAGNTQNNIDLSFDGTAVLY